VTIAVGSAAVQCDEQLREHPHLQCVRVIFLILTANCSMDLHENPKAENSFSNASLGFQERDVRHCMQVQSRLTRPLRPPLARASQEAAPTPPQPSPPLPPPPARFWSAISTRSDHTRMLSKPKVHRLRRGIERGAYVASLESVSDPATITGWGGHAWHATGHGCLARTNRTPSVVACWS
jgi:hypothetical protein